MSLKWDIRFLELAKMVAGWSKDPSTKVGAVIVNDLKQVVGMGYNGFPRGVNDSEERLNDRPTKYSFVVHAELNAVLQAGALARGATMYIWPTFPQPDPVDGVLPCKECANPVIQAGIKEVVGYLPDPLNSEDHERSKRWGDSLAIAKIKLVEAGVTWRGIKKT